MTREQAIQSLVSSGCLRISQRANETPQMKEIALRGEKQNYSLFITPQNELLAVTPTGDITPFRFQNDKGQQVEAFVVDGRDKPLVRRDN